MMSVIIDEASSRSIPVQGKTGREGRCDENLVLGE